MRVFKISSQRTLLLATFLMVLLLTLTLSPFEGIVQVFRHGQPKPQSVESQPPAEKFLFEMVGADEKEAIEQRLPSMKDEDWEAETIRLVEKNKIDDKYIIIAVANNGHREFTLNWIASLKRNNYHKFIVFCLDSMLYEAIAERSLSANAVVVPRKWLHGPIFTEEVLWGTERHRLLTHIKVIVAQKLLEWGHTVVFSDVDLVWLNPNIIAHIEYVSENADVAHMLDFVDDMNSGFYLAKPTPFAKSLFQEAIEILKQFGGNAHDQGAFNGAMQSGMNRKYSKHFYRLDKLMYPNGEVNFLLGLNKKMDIRPMIVHANYVVGAKKKKEILESQGMWYI